MRANDAQPPSQSMLDYLSKKRSGPSASIVTKRFDSLTSFQAQVIRRFYEHQQEAELHDRLQLANVSADLDSGVVPLELFSPFPHDPEASQEDTLAISQKLDSIYKNNTAGVAEAIVERLGAKETIRRYAKFKVLEELLPQIEPAARLTISRGLDNQSFMAAIRKKDPIPPGDIEYTALAEGFFDYIWPDDVQIESLKLDQGYRDSRASYNEQTRRRRQNKRLALPVKT